jgi:TPR repeat protein
VLGQLYQGYCLDQGVTQDKIAAARYFKLTADQNNDAAGLRYGECLSDGLGVSVDLRRAAEYIERVFNQNPKLGANRFGLCHEFGTGVPGDLDRAAECYRIGANLDDGAQRNFGFCLQDGLGVGIDFEAAAEYYGLSASQGNLDGAFHYAVCLHYGIGVDADFEMAVEYYSIAARRPFVSCRDSFRCRRCLATAKFNKNQFSEFASIRSITFDDCCSRRPFEFPSLLSDLVLDSPRSLSASARPQTSWIGSGGSIVCDNPNGNQTI